jgi:hypothetical protein
MLKIPILSPLFAGMVRSKSGSNKKYKIGALRKWATLQELDEMGLLVNREGVFLGAHRDSTHRFRYLRDKSKQHILAIIPSARSRVDQTIIPTLLTWRDSMVLLDIGGKYWEKSSGWRGKYAKNRVLRFDPLSLNDNNVKYNPLEEIRIGTSYVWKDVELVVTSIVVGKDYYHPLFLDALISSIIIMLYLYTKEHNGEKPHLAWLYDTLHTQVSKEKGIFSDFQDREYLMKIGIDSDTSEVIGNAIGKYQELDAKYMLQQWENFVSQRKTNEAGN